MIAGRPRREHSGSRAGWHGFGAISRREADADWQPTGGTATQYDVRRIGPMFRVDGLGEDGRAAVRMAVRRRTPFEYSPDGRTWTEIDDDEGQAFRVYGLLDPRQVIANVPTLDPARFEESADFFKPGMSEIDGSVRLDRWSPPLPRSFAEFLSAAESDRRIRMVFVEGRVLEIEQPDLAPFSGDQIRVVYHYRPVTPRAVLEWWLGALVGWIRRVRGR